MDFTSNKEENHSIGTHNDESWKEKAKENRKARVHIATARIKERKKKGNQLKIGNNNYIRII
jgi:hypothetical protein